MRGSAGSENLDALLAHSGWLRRLAAQLVRDAADQDDAFQETWAAALRSPPDPRRPARPWLAQVLRNLVRMRARGQGRTRPRLGDVSEPALDAPTAEETLERVELQRTVAELVAALPEPYRSTVVMRYFEEREPSDIAAALKLPPGTVRWRLKEGLDQLRALMDERLGGRRAWTAGLAPIADPEALPWWLKGAGIMTKGKLIVAGVVLVAGVWVVTVGRSGGTPGLWAGSPGPSVAGAHSAGPLPAPAAGAARTPAAPGALAGQARPPRFTGPAASGGHGPAESAEERPGRSPLEGKLDPGTLSAAIRSRMGDIKGCYERLVLADERKASGRIDVQFTISAKGDVGRITEAAIKPPQADASVPELASPLLQQCMLNALADMDFPAPRGGDVEVTFPFLFVANDEPAAPPPARR